MKKLIVALLLLSAPARSAGITPIYRPPVCAAAAPAAPGHPYFKTILADPAHPKVSASVLYTMAYEFDGASADAAAVWHKGSKEDTLWPQKLLDWGAPPISWTLLEVGAGGNRESAFLRAGASVDIAPTLLGPVTQALSRAGGRAAKLGALLVAPDGNSGVRLGLGWKTTVLRDGNPQRLSDLRFPPRWALGYTYSF